MSQAKVDRYKEEKQKREKLQKKEKKRVTALENSGHYRAGCSCWLDWFLGIPECSERCVSYI